MLSCLCTLPAADCLLESLVIHCVLVVLIAWALLQLSALSKEILIDFPVCQENVWKQVTQLLFESCSVGFVAWTFF